MAQKKKNSVNSTEKNKSYTRVEKNTKVNSYVKKEIEEENSNKKIIIIALVFALSIAVLCYWKGCVNKSDENSNNKTEQKEEISTEEEKEVEEESNSAYDNDYVFEILPVVKEEIIEDEEEKAEIVPEVEEVYYALTFESNGGSDVETQILGVNEVTTYELPTKDGWIFAGWFSDETFTEEYIFDTHLTEDVTVYAKWVKNIRYKYNQELLEDINTVALGEEIPLLSSDDERFELIEKQELGWFVISENENPYEILPGTVLEEDLADKFDTEIVLDARILSKFDMKFNFKVQVIEEETTPEEVEIETVELNDETVQQPSLTERSVVQEVVEGRTIPFDEVDSKIKTEYPEFTNEDYGWYYNINDVMYNLPDDAVANPEIIEVHMGEVVTITYIEREVVDEETGETVDKEITKENIVKDSHIDEDDILVPEEKEDKEFIGWFPVIDENGTLGGDKLTSDTIIDEDKIFVGQWKDIEEEIETPVIEETLPEEVVDQPAELESQEQLEEESINPIVEEVLPEEGNINSEA